MKTSPYLPHVLLACLALAAAPATHAEIAPGELVAPKMEISGGNVNFTIQPSVSGRNYQLQYSDTMADGTWTNVGVLRSGDGDDLVISTPYESAVQRRFFRITLVEATPSPAGFSLISAGSFEMGNALAASDDGAHLDELPVHPVYVSAFYMAKYEVTKTLWDEVREWGLANGYTDLATGAGKASTHPVQTITWYDMVKWCNARSQKEGLIPCYYTDAAQTVASIYKTGTPTINNTMVKWSANGYRLPTEAEWEKAARGGLSGKRFPWGDTINHTYANYYNYNYFYESPQNQGYHPLWSNNDDGYYPYTSPVGSFAANGYGLYDMAGNVWEWCWDWYSSSYYKSSPGSDPRGADSGSGSGSGRVYRGGNWGYDAVSCRVADRGSGDPSNGYYDNSMGFRPARSSVP
jgi:formylglycine-generating enzyme required for sulfatase activity